MSAWNSLPSLPLPPQTPNFSLLVLFLMMAISRQENDSEGIYQLALENCHQSPQKRPRNHSILWTALHVPGVSACVVQSRDLQASGFHFCMHHNAPRIHSVREQNNPLRATEGSQSPVKVLAQEGRSSWREGQRGKTAIASGPCESLLTLGEMKATAEGKFLLWWVYLTDPRAGPQCDPLLSHSQEFQTG